MMFFFRQVNLMLIYFSDFTKKMEGQVDAPALHFQKVTQNNEFMFGGVLLLRIELICRHVSLSET